MSFNVVSGGQTGADIGGLEAAICCDLDPETSYRLEFADGSNPSVVPSGRVFAESGVDVALFVLPLPAGIR